VSVGSAFSGSAESIGSDGARRLRLGVDVDEVVRCICVGVGRSDSCGARLRDGRSTVSRKVTAASFY
jgi:hypothetical protein